MLNNMLDEAIQRYACQGFHADLPGGKAAGELWFDGQGLNYAIGPLTGQLDYNPLRLKLGGAGKRLVFFEHSKLHNIGSDASDLSLYTSDLSVLQNGYLKTHPACGQQVLRARTTKAAAWGWVIGVFLLMALVPLMLFWRMDWVSHQVAKQVPLAWEQTLGESVNAQMRLTQKEMDAKTVDESLTPLVTPLLKALKQSPYAYHFKIVNEGSINAFALPGGYITIHSGLILKAQTAEELLGVLGHEIIHVEQRHGVRAIIGSSGIYLLASTLLGDVSGLLATVSSAAPLLLTQQYSRAFETEADERAVTLLDDAEINPIGLPEFFKKMIEEEKIALEKVDNEQAKEALKVAMAMLSTHPASEQRMKTLQEQVALQTGPYLNLQPEFTALQQAVKTFVEGAPAVDNTSSSQNSSVQSSKAESSSSSLNQL